MKTIIFLCILGPLTLISTACVPAIPNATREAAGTVTPNPITLTPTLDPSPTAMPATATPTPPPQSTATLWPTITQTFTEQPTSTPIPNPAGLTIIENELVGLVNLDVQSFTPQQVMAFRDAQQMVQPVYQYSMADRPDYVEAQYPMTGGTQYEALLYEYNGDINDMRVRLEHNGKVIFQANAGNNSPVQMIRGLWVSGDHWTLEIAYTVNTLSGNTVNVNATGQIYQDGVLLNQKFGYQEMFGYQILDGRPFYFYKKDGLIHLSYDGQDLPITYDAVQHYGCCDAGGVNPLQSPGWVVFFGQRAGVWYLSEIGKK